MKNEIWRDIEGYEGLYQVSNKGRVKSVERIVWDNRGYYKTIQEKILKPEKTKWGYLRVVLCRDNKKKHYMIHRLVGQVFLENPQNLPVINHIDENKENNCSSNLEWCSISYNNNYNDRTKKIAEKLSKPVFSIDKISGLILEFPSAHEASRQTGINQSHICDCCNGKRKSAGGYYWHYAENDSYNHYMSQNDREY